MHKNKWLIIVPKTYINTLRCVCQMWQSDVGASADKVGMRCYCGPVDGERAEACCSLSTDMTLRVIELPWLACCIVKAVMTVCLKGQCVKPSCSLLLKIHQVALRQCRWALTIRFQRRTCCEISASIFAAHATAFKFGRIRHPTHKCAFT